MYPGKNETEHRPKIQTKANRDISTPIPALTCICLYIQALS